MELKWGMLEKRTLERKCVKVKQKQHWLAWRATLYTKCNITGKTTPTQALSLHRAIQQRVDCAATHLAGH
jgi:hypothetical protein